MNDENQFEILFHTYWRAVFIFFRNRGCPPDEARDLAQETFLEVHKSLPRFRNEHPRGWILAIARHRWLKMVRARSTLKRSAEILPIEDLTLSASESLTTSSRSADALQLLVVDEEKRAFQDALEDLPPQMRQCLRLRIDQGLKYREIAAVLQINVQTVKSHLSQAKTRLRDTLGTAPDAVEAIEKEVGDA
ncbi:MAG: RNA polymerase sigma factor [Acidobacteriota bacterium]